MKAFQHTLTMKLATIKVYKKKKKTGMPQSALVPPMKTTLVWSHPVTPDDKVALHEQH